MSESDAAGVARTLTLMAPLSGCLVPIESVPDPVFAQKMVGDGVSIDPVSNLLVAPCAGRVVQIHPAGHAVTLSTDGGLEVMMHIGLDTVHLKGDGFSPKVRAGEQVRTGTPLIGFDADRVAMRARSLLTQVIVTTADRIESLRPASGQVRAGEDAILELRLRDDAAIGGEALTAKRAEGFAETAVPQRSETLVIPNRSGLHARPAAVLANLARRFKAEIKLQRGDRTANARSVVAIMGMDVKCGDKVQVIASGPDAASALATIVPALQAGLGESPDAASGGGADAGATAAGAAAGLAGAMLGAAAGSAPVAVSAGAALAAAAMPPLAVAGAAGQGRGLRGVSASPGLAIGKVFRWRGEALDVAERGDDPALERRRLAQALEQGKGQLQALHDRMAAGRSGAVPGESETDGFKVSGAGAAQAEIFAAHRELLDDPELLGIAESAIAKGCSAGFAWRAAVQTYSSQLAAMANPLLAARANDLRDVGERVLRILAGAGERRLECPTGSVIVAEDLTPSDTAGLDRQRVVGFVTVGGGATSHVAILARAMGMPAIAGIDPAALGLADGVTVILDGSQGRLISDPTPDELATACTRISAATSRREAEQAAAGEPAVTVDGHRVEVVANLGGVAEAKGVVDAGGEGVGLMRSEFLFLNRATPPSEDEQAEAYAAIARTLGPDRPLIVRTLDVGGDKPLAYLPLPAEDNPFLGERGIRVGLDRPELLRAQLRAILRASAHGKLLVMFPMIAALSEWRAAHGMLLEEAARLGVRPVPAGLMIEVPSAALLAEHFAREAAFFSIGTNDLTQYTLAMDRGHPKLASKIDGLDPAVLRLIAMTVEAAHRHQRWVGVCGGLAGDPQAVPVLIGLGVDELSVSVPAIAAVKAQVRRCDLARCRQLAADALSRSGAAEVRALVGVALG